MLVCSYACRQYMQANTHMYIVKIVCMCTCRLFAHANTRIQLNIDMLEGSYIRRHYSSYVDPKVTKTSQVLYLACGQNHMAATVRFSEGH